MRGTILLLDTNRPGRVDGDALRLRGLLVYQCHELAGALTRLEQLAPDAVVAALPAGHVPATVPAVRGMVDYATSIIVVSAAGERQASRDAGADGFLLDSAPPADLLDRIHRALILRRSGRRLPWI